MASSDGSSSGGSFFGGVLGAVVGFFFGGGITGAVKGFMYGSTLGGLLAPPTGPDQFGPRLDSLTLTTSSNTAILPRSYGTVAHKCNLIWAKDGEYVEVATTKKVKTGLFSKTKVTTYSYFFTGAYAFHKGEISQVLRIWHAGGRDLVYNATSTDTDTNIASGDLASYITIYKGTADQAVDPLISEDVGAASCSAYRGVCYIVYDMYPLANYQNNVGALDPKIEYTTVTSAESAIALLANIPADDLGETQDHWPWLHNVTHVSEEGAHLWRLGEGDSSGFTLTVPGNHYTATPDGSLVYRGASSPLYGGGDRANNIAAHGKSDRRVFVSSSMYVSETYVGTGGTNHPLITQTTNWVITPQTFGSLWEDFALPYYTVDGTLSEVFDSLFTHLTYSDDRVYKTLFGIAPYDGNVQQTIVTATSFIFRINNGVGTYLFTAATGDPSVGFSGLVPESWYGEAYTYDVMFRVFVHDEDFGEVRTYLIPVGSSIPAKQTHYCYLNDVLFFAYTISGVNYIRKITESGSQTVASFSGSLAGLSLIKIGPLNDQVVFVFSDAGACVLASMDTDLALSGTIDETDVTVTSSATVTTEFGDNTSDFYNNVSFDFDNIYYCLGGHIYKKPSITGTETDIGAAASLILGDDYPSFFNIFGYGNFLAVSTYGGAMDKTGVEIFRHGVITDPGTVLLSDIITAECDLVGLESTDIDVTTIDQEVRGYTVSEIGSVRNVLSQLQACYPFDIIQSGNKLKFVKRGTSSVATVSWEDLGKEVSLTQDREMESLLPYKVELKYIDKDLNYQPNIQFSERASESKNIVSLNIPIVLTPDEAAQMADVLHSIYFMERRTFAFTLPPTYRYLEPADIITLAMQDVSYVVRLTNVHYLSDGSMQCAAKQHVSTSYSSTAVGSAGPVPVDTIPSIANPIAGIFDMPVIADSQNKPGYSAVMTSLADSWPGGTLYRTTDNQASWQSVVGFGTGSVWGTCSTALSEHGGHVVDEAGLLTVKPYSGSLVSVTEAQFLAEETLIVYGAPGRWEIIGYKTAASNSDGTYTLSYLMRGRRGTEQYTGTHEIGDYFALISSAKFVGASTANIDGLIVNRAITTGRDLESGYNINLTYAGVNLTPLSPVGAFGSRDGSGNLTGYFMRRSRLNDGLDMLDRMYSGVPLGEDTESYEIDVLSGSTVVRTITATSETFAYSAAEQTTDFGSAQSSIDVNIYQISAAVGRGYALGATI